MVFHFSRIGLREGIDKPEADINNHVEHVVGIEVFPENGSQEKNKQFYNRKFVDATDRWLTERFI